MPPETELYPRTMIEADDNQLVLWLQDMNVAALRTISDRISALYQELAKDALDLIHRLGNHHLPEARMLAGYCMSWCASREWMQVCELATRLADDSCWPVREAVTFGVRDALIDAFDIIFPDIVSWVESPSVNLRRGYLVMARLPARQSQKDMVRVLNALEKIMPDKAEYVRKNKAWVLTSIGRNHPDLLIEYLDRWVYASDEEVLWSVATALTGTIVEMRPRESFAVLYILAADRRPYVRRAVTRAVIAAMKDSSSEVSDFLASCERDPERSWIVLEGKCQAAQRRKKGGS